MTEGVYIIHDSTIVQLGLAAMLQRHFNCRVRTFAVFHDFLSSAGTTSGASVVITGQELSMRPDFKEFLSEHPGMTAFVLLNQAPREEQESPEHFISLDHSPTEICNRIDRALRNPGEEKQASELTSREIEVLRLLAMGNSNKEIAAKLFISTHTVISHRKNISEKLSIRSASGLTVYAVLNNYIDTSNLDIGDLI
jgi:DNA-binding CsgD family transcriptional regulator